MNNKQKKRILLSLDWFAPGYKAGGPIRSCVNFAYAMQDKYEVFVITGNKDFGASNPYPGISSNTWTAFDQNIQVKYCDVQGIDLGFWKRELKALSPDFIYMNNLFSKNFGFLLYLAKSVAPKYAKWFLSPRGIFRESAIQYKSLKKKVYIGILRFLGLQKNIHFIASDHQESLDIKKYFGNRSQVKIIGNFPYSQQTEWKNRQKEVGKLKVVFFARINPI